MYYSTDVGRGESNLAIAVSALKEGFNGRAVDHISLALRDLTKYVCVCNSMRQHDGVFTLQSSKVKATVCVYLETDWRLL